ncbi:MAG: GNAT family N-acetyltransferase [Acidobacteria bacterium]|nr:GNAT family N-acetyltransferase [Acidobacteriota bacterium]
MRKERLAALDQESSIVLRPLRESDIAAIIAIDERTSGKPKPEYWRRKLTRYVQEGQFQSDADGSVLARVAEAEGTVVGFMVGEIRRWEFGLPYCGWITALGTDPDRQRLGIGRRLLAELLDYYREKGLEEVRTIVEWADGDILQFFHSMGFVRGPFVELQKSL